VSTWTRQPLVDASIAFASQFPRTVVAEPPIWGEDKMEQALANAPADQRGVGD